ncbi:ogr/Delta-like zinc finger family protein [Serratia fonticola]|uniref:ogr/Delta-like zinc finger family protein n=1 Tax=Serratia fonticola TaxID=47917 RepID=UPI0027F7592B|nr:ogr/Delta-like zinc finger family protein [Serratia fonticola]MDQ7209038.1 ogr/Delta-like zinc finger family protein [Serratia fonticola]
MMHCPLCGGVAHTRSSRYLTEKTKERYHQCRNADCRCSFATHETVERLIVSPTRVNRVEPHPAIQGRNP